MQSASNSLPIHAAQISFAQNTRNRLYTMNTVQEMEPLNHMYFCIRHLSTVRYETHNPLSLPF